jgi:thiol:disulfide interchange protein
MSEALYNPRPERWFRFRLSALFGLLTAAAVVAVYWASYLESTRPIQWLPFSKSAVQLENANGHAVLVNFWADWDQSSSMLEATTVDTPRVRQLLRSKGVTAMRADWSAGAQEIYDEIEAVGGHSIPLTVLYPPSGKPRVLRDFDNSETSAQVLEALEGLTPVQNTKNPFSN